LISITLRAPHQKEEAGGYEKTTTPKKNADPRHAHVPARERGEPRRDCDCAYGARGAYGPRASVADGLGLNRCGSRRVRARERVHVEDLHFLALLSFRILLLPLFGEAHEV
jgi:hypothetical protein